MKKTTIQKSIETFANVKTPINSTMQASKQALYNRIFHARLASSFKPLGHETKFELLYGYNVHVAITRHLLKSLSSRGNMNALELLNNINHTVSLEDLTQEMLLTFVELEEQWNIDNAGKVTFLNDETIKTVFSCVTNYLYRFQTKHYKHQYIELDNDIVDITKVSQLAEHVSIENIHSNVHFETFYNMQLDNDKKWIEYRLQGYSNSKISEIMQVTYKVIRCTENRVRKNWEKYNK